MNWTLKQNNYLKQFQNPWDEKSKFLGHAPCPKCGSRDNVGVWENGAYCFTSGCTFRTRDSSLLGFNSSLLARNPRLSRVKEKGIELNQQLKSGVLYRLKDRGLSEDTCAKYGVTVLVKDKKIVGHLYPYFEGDKHVANKTRYLRPMEDGDDYSVEGSLTQSGLFGQQLFPKGSARALTITEGELDALSAFQMQGSKYPVVSIKTGAKAAAGCIKQCLEYIESFEEVRICFDSDRPGREAAERVAQIISPGKARIVRLDKDLKDANGYLIAGKQAEFIDRWWKAELYTPAGIISASELKSRIRNRKQVPSLFYPWSGLNELTYGIRQGEAVIFHAPPGTGKTQVLREIVHHILKTDSKAKIGTMFLEEIPEDSGLGLMSIEASIPFHLPDAVYKEKDIEKAESILDEDRVFFYDSFGSTNIDDIISRVRYYVRGLDCKYIILDHLSIIVSDHTQGDERKLLDHIITKLKTLTIELNMALIAVVHENREGQIHGTSGIEKLANTIVRLNRDKLSSDKAIRNTTFLTVLKNRFSGKTGPACALRYDESTGRLEEVDEAFDILKGQEDD